MPGGDILFQRLRSCSEAELEVLAAILGTKRTADREFDVVALSAALRGAAGNSIANMFRDAHDLEYREIVTGVARVLSSNLDWPLTLGPNVRIDHIEDYVSVAASIANDPKRTAMSKEDLAEAQKLADAALKGETPPKVELSLIEEVVAIGVGVAVGYFAFTAVALFGAGAFITAPATKKTVPAVVLLIHSRRRQEFEEQLGAHRVEAA